MRDQNKKYYPYKYEPFPRWASYWYQIHEVMQLKPKKVLEIGIGDKVAANYLKDTGIDLITLDINKNLSPDITASVIDIPVPDNSYDAVLAAEILEHLPYDYFIKALKEIHRVSKKYAVISLPHTGSVLAFSLKVPGIKWIRSVIRLAYFGRNIKDKQGHYWEIGAKGFSFKKIKKQFKQSGFQIKNDYVIVEYPYHHFFILEKK